MRRSLLTCRNALTTTRYLPYTIYPAVAILQQTLKIAALPQSMFPVAALLCIWTLRAIASKTMARHIEKPKQNRSFFYNEEQQARQKIINTVVKELPHCDKNLVQKVVEQLMATPMKLTNP